MNRYEFLKSMGFTGAALMAAMTSCIYEKGDYTPVTKTDPNNTTTTTSTISATPIISTSNLNAIANPLLKIDLATSALKTVGAYIVQANIVVAQISAGAYAAVTNLCPHESKRKVIYDNVTSQFFCTNHGATFDINGIPPKNSITDKPITAYKVATDGKTLVVY